MSWWLEKECLCEGPSPNSHCLSSVGDSQGGSGECDTQREGLKRAIPGSPSTFHGSQVGVQGCRRAVRRRERGDQIMRLLLGAENNVKLSTKYELGFMAAAVLSAEWPLPEPTGN